MCKQVTPDMMKSLKNYRNESDSSNISNAINYLMRKQKGFDSFKESN